MQCRAMGTVMLSRMGAYNTLRERYHENQAINRVPDLRDGQPPAGASCAGTRPRSATPRSRCGAAAAVGRPERTTSTRSSPRPASTCGHGTLENGSNNPANHDRIVSELARSGNELAKTPRGTAGLAAATRTHISAADSQLVVRPQHECTSPSPALQTGWTAGEWLSRLVEQSRAPRPTSSLKASRLFTAPVEWDASDIGRR